MILLALKSSCDLDKLHDHGGRDDAALGQTVLTRGSHYLSSVGLPLALDSPATRCFLLGAKGPLPASRGPGPRFGALCHASHWSAAFFQWGYSHGNQLQ